MTYGYRIKTSMVKTGMDGLIEENKKQVKSLQDQLKEAESVRTNFSILGSDIKNGFHIMEGHTLPYWNDGFDPTPSMRRSFYSARSNMFLVKAALTNSAKQKKRYELCAEKAAALCRFYNQEAVRQEGLTVRKR